MCFSACKNEIHVSISWSWNKPTVFLQGSWLQSAHNSTFWRVSKPHITCPTVSAPVYYLSMYICIWESYLRICLFLYYAVPEHLLFGWFALFGRYLTQNNFSRLQEDLFDTVPLSANIQIRNNPLLCYPMNLTSRPSFMYYTPCMREVTLITVPEMCYRICSCDL